MSMLTAEDSMETCKSITEPEPSIGDDVSGYDITSLNIQPCAIKNCPVDLNLDRSWLDECPNCLQQVHPLSLLPCLSCRKCQCIFCHLKAVKCLPESVPACSKCQQPPIKYTQHQMDQLKMVHEAHKQQFELLHDLKQIAECAAKMQQDYSGYSGGSTSDDDTLRGVPSLTAYSLFASRRSCQEANLDASPQESSASTVRGMD